jgi:hypothetical protein
VRQRAIGGRVKVENARPNASVADHQMACAGELGAAGNHVIACAGAAFPGTGSAASAGAANAKSAAVRMAEPSRKPLQRTGVSDWPIVVGSACVRDRAAVLDVIADLQSGVGEAGDPLGFPISAGSF